MKKVLLLLMAVSLTAANSFAHISLIDQHHSKKQDVEIKVEKVAGNVYVLFGQGGNIGISFGDDGLLLIDTQFQNIADKIKAELKKIGTDQSRFVFNTHWHGDHTGGNPVFGIGSTIIAHSNVRNRLLDPIGRDGKPRDLPAKAALPMITFDLGLSLYFNGEEIKAVHFPKGHTDGDTVIFFTKSNVVHLGDDFFVGRFPFVDLNSGGSVEGLIKNIDSLVGMIPADARLIPGHGKVSTLKDLKDYHQMLIETTTIVRDQIKAGKSLDEIKKKGLPEKFKEAGSGFIKTDAWIETIFKSHSVSMAAK